MQKILLTTICILFAKSNFGQISVYNENSMPRTVDQRVLHSIQTYLDSFLLTKDVNPRYNKFWDSTDYSIFFYPHLDIHRAEYSRVNNKEGFYKPLILNVNRIDSGTYEVKLAFIGISADCNTPSLRLIYNLLAIRTSNGAIKFKKRTQYYVRNWARHKVGSINYIITLGKDLNPTRAKQMDSANKSISEYLKVPQTNIQYYLCRNASEVFHLKGFDFVSAMFLDTIGGMVETLSPIVYAGNNSELYIHEVVHIYLQKHFAGRTNYIIAEGLPTFLGGSADLSLDYHIKNLQNYIKYNNTTIEELLNSGHDIGGHTSSYYALAGMLCKLVHDKHGQQGILDFILTSDDEWVEKFADLMDIKPSQLHDFIMTNIISY